MSERDIIKPNSQDDLADVKSLIGNADAGDFELDDILAEYGVTPDDGHGAVPVNPADQSESNVIAFPGVYFGAEDETEQEELPPQGDPAPEVSGEESPSESELPSEESEASEESFDDGPELFPVTRRSAEVIPFPTETLSKEENAPEEDDGTLTTFIKDLNRRADDYADHMYEEDERIDPDEVRRLEQLIPGTDKEEEPEQPKKLKKEKKLK